MKAAMRARDAARLSALRLLLPALPQRGGAEGARAGETALAEAGASGPKDMGKVMGLLKARLAGRADMGKVSALVKTRLSGGKSGGGPRFVQAGPAQSGR